MALPLKLGGLRKAATQPIGGHLGPTPCRFCASATQVLWRNVAEALRRMQFFLQPIGGTGGATRSPAELATAVAQLQGAGSVLPTLDRLAEGGRPPLAFVEHVPGQPLRGWQRASAACFGRIRPREPFRRPWPSFVHMMSPQAAQAAPVPQPLPTAAEFRLSSSCFRVLLRQPVPIGPRRCRCGDDLDALGDHHAACPTAGVLGARGAALESCARVPRSRPTAAAMKS